MSTVKTNYSRKRCIKIAYRHRSLYEEECAVAYAVGALSKPKPRCGPLAVLDSVDSAKALVKGIPRASWGSLQVMICRCLVSRKAAMYREDGFDRFPIEDAPLGTMLVSSLRVMSEFTPADLMESNVVKQAWANAYNDDKEV